MDGAIRELGHLRKLRLPGRNEARTIRFDPMAFCHHPQGDAVLLHWSDQSDASLDLAIVKHETRSGNLNGRTSRTLVDQQDGARVAEPIKGLIQPQRMIAFALADGEKPGLGAGRRMGINRPPVSDDKALGAERFQADVVDA